MDVGADGPGHAVLEGARARWRATGDRVWSIAMVDGEGYRRAAELVGAVLAVVRELTPTLESLLALDADPAPVLDRWPDDGSSGLGHRAVLEAACAVRGDELVAARARDRRIAVIEAARAGGEVWVVLDAPPAGFGRWVEMHLASGLALVASADPYAGEEPYALGETVLDAVTGVPVTGPADRDASFAEETAWRDEWARWRGQIESRLDDEDTMISDKRRP